MCSCSVIHGKRLFGRPIQRTLSSSVIRPFIPDVVASQWVLPQKLDANAHDELLTTLHNVQGLVMLFGYENNPYAKRLVTWRKVRVAERASLNISKSKPRTELWQIWMNYDERGQKIA